MMNGTQRRPTPARPVGLPGKLLLLLEVWAIALLVELRLRRESLSAVVDTLSPDRGRTRRPPTLLSGAVSRGLRFGPWQPRCLLRSLVLYRLLRAQGDLPVLVIGLAEHEPSPDAHAWVELNGRDIGPAPGAEGHRALARYPVQPPSS
jgi:Transglutaminase-like superfamily